MNMDGNQEIICVFLSCLVTSAINTPLKAELSYPANDTFC